MSEMNGLQKLAVAQAMLNQLKAATDPHGGKRGEPTLRTDADDALERDFEESGTSQRRIYINDMEVGTLSARISKAETTTEIAVDDMPEFVRWLLNTDDGADTVKQAVAASPQTFVRAAESIGFLPDGCRVQDVERPARWLGTTLRIDAKKVGEALGAELPSAVAGVLTDGA